MKSKFIFLYWDEPIWGKKSDEEKPQVRPQHNSDQDQLNSDTDCNQDSDTNKDT